jgi:hypothetical protein
VNTAVVMLYLARRLSLFGKWRGFPDFNFGVLGRAALFSVRPTLLGTLYNQFGIQTSHPTLSTLRPCFGG